jgi:hypothetical protein
MIWTVRVVRRPRAAQHRWHAMATAMTHWGGLKTMVQWASSDVVNFYMGNARWGTHRRGLEAAVMSR